MSTGLTNYTFSPRRGLGVILKRVFEATNGYEGEGNYRYVKVENTEPKGKATLLTLPGFFFPPSLVRPYLRRRVQEWDSDYKAGVSPSPVIKVGDELLPPESLDGHVGVYEHFFENYFSEHDGPIDINGHSYAYQIIRRQLVELQHDPRIREVIIVAPYIRKPDFVVDGEDLLKAGRTGHKKELFRALQDGRIEEFILSMAGFNQYEKNAKRFEVAFRMCLEEMLTFSLEDNLPAISEVPVKVFLPKNDFLTYKKEDEAHLRTVFTHPESDVIWVSGGHNKIFLRLAEGMRDISQKNRLSDDYLRQLKDNLDYLQTIIVT